LHLGGDLWVSVFDGHQDTTLYSGDHLLKMELEDLNDDGYLDLKIDGTILFFGEKGEEAIHTQPVFGEFIYMPAEGVFKPCSLQMLKLHTAKVEPAGKQARQMERKPDPEKPAKDKQELERKLEEFKKRLEELQESMPAADERKQQPEK
jgi:hypothetical protein